MTTHSQSQPKTVSTSTASSTLVSTRRLQRKCACGNHAMGGACEECMQKREGTLQGAAINPSAEGAPPIVHNVLHSSGQALDAETRAFMEPRFGRDFSHVRVHTDAKAAESARSVNALAYTVGSRIGFDTGQYMPSTLTGRALIAHELTHVVQQEGMAPGLDLPIGRRDDLAEREAQTIASRIIAEPVNVRPFTHITANRPTLARGEKWDAFWDVGPWDAYKAKQLADKALSAAKGTKLPGLHNGPADAWRHCYWNCTMTAEIGADQAKTIADNHEKHGGGPANENTMDYHNNHAGRLCGGKNCDGCCQDKLTKGELRVLDASKLVVPSTPTPRPTPTSPGSGEYKY